MNGLKTFILGSLLTIGYLHAGCQSSGPSGNSVRKGVDAKTFSEMLIADAGAPILDVRSEGEFRGGYIKGAQNWPIGSQKLANGLNDLDKSRTVYVYCLSGGRSSSVAAQMASAGFTSIVELNGGMMAWGGASLPVEMPGKATPDAVSREQYSTITGAGLVLVDFYAPWCAPCKKMEPMLDSLQKELGDKVKIVRINVDENKGLIKEQNISDIPVFRYFNNGSQQWQHNGFISRESLLQKMGI